MFFLSWGSKLDFFPFFELMQLPKIKCLIGLRSSLAMVACIRIQSGSYWYNLQVHLVCSCINNCYHWMVLRTEWKHCMFAKPNLTKITKFVACVTKTRNRASQQKCSYVPTWGGQTLWVNSRVCQLQVLWKAFSGRETLGGSNAVSMALNPAAS